MRTMADPLEEIPREKLDALREALAALVREGVSLTVRVLRERAGAKTEHAGLVLAAYRAGKFSLDVQRPAPRAVTPAAPAPPPSPPPIFVGPRSTDPPAPAPPPSPGAPTAEQLAGLVACVDSHEKSLDATREVMRAIALGMTCPACGGDYAIDQKAARLLIDGLGEARQAIKGAALEGGEEIESFLPCTDEAFPLVEAFEGIEDDAARASVLAFAIEQLALDRARRPSLDTGGADGAQATTGGTA
jgi:hypothetical protein